MESGRAPGQEYAGWTAPEVGVPSGNTSAPERFDMKQRLAQIKEIRRNQEGILTPSQSRQLARRELSELRFDLETQQKNIESSITNALQSIEDYPDVTAGELLGDLKYKAEELKFSQEILSSFQTAFQQYEEKHRLVESYCDLYNPEELFEKCFGIKPKGYMEFVKRPMCILFRCFDKEDYVAAVNFSKVHGNLANLSDDETNHSLQSGGAFVGEIGIQELEDAVVIENCARYGYEFRDGGMMGINMPKNSSIELNLRSDNVVFRGNGAEWQIKLLGYDSKKDQSHMQLVKNSKEGQKVLLDIAIIPHRDENGAITHCGFRESNGDGNELEKLEYELLDQASNIARISIDDGLTLTYNDAGQGSQILSSANVEEINQISESTLRHEEQHVYNKLFTPIERSTGMESVINQAISIGDFEKSKSFLIDQVVRDERKNIGIDTAVRDEIIAFYRHGEDLSKIENILLNSDLYDYKNDEYYKQQILQIPDRVKTCLARVGQLMGQPERESAATEDNVIQNKINQVFGENYSQDVNRWLGAIRNLEDKGYTRDEIVPMLYTAPVGGWVSIASRKTAKT